MLSGISLHSIRLGSVSLRDPSSEHTTNLVALRPDVTDLPVNVDNTYFISGTGVLKASKMRMMPKIYCFGRLSHSKPFALDNVFPLETHSLIIF